MRRKHDEQRPAARARRPAAEKTSSATDLAGSHKLVGGGAAASGKPKEPIKSSEFPYMAYGVNRPLQADALE